jgi:hypothetical protein
VPKNTAMTRFNPQKWVGYIASRHSCGDISVRSIANVKKQDGIYKRNIQTWLILFCIAEQVLRFLERVPIDYPNFEIPDRVHC